ncbi:hypothetical protein FNF28_01775 [Cafeteria roenbergensis]|uniref:Rieske domain-containing protein n=1 Tax=Cafeteria roenbergensis TaxID=33653 RepID=A0A5A8DWW2_CAFRO|nr:hypothetical protein FNF28_01775 [Cafeteria roenbergensis]
MRRWSRLRQRRVVHRAAAGRITAGAVACCHHGAAPARGATRDRCCRACRSGRAVTDGGLLASTSPAERC